MTEHPRVWESTHDGLFASRDAGPDDKKTMALMQRWAQREIKYVDVLRELGLKKSVV